MGRLGGCCWNIVRSDPVRDGKYRPDLLEKNVIFLWIEVNIASVDSYPLTERVDIGVTRS